MRNAGAACGIDFSREVVSHYGGAVEWDRRLLKRPAECRSVGAVGCRAKQMGTETGAYPVPRSETPTEMTSKVVR